MPYNFSILEEKTDFPTCDSTNKTINSSINDKRQNPRSHRGQPERQCLQKSDQHRNWPRVQRLQRDLEQLNQVEYGSLGSGGVTFSLYYQASFKGEVNGVVTADLQPSHRFGT